MNIKEAAITDFFLIEGGQNRKTMLFVQVDVVPPKVNAEFGAANYRQTDDYSC